MILIDLVYINSAGGVTMSSEVLKKIRKKHLEKKFEILVDERNHNYFRNKTIKTIVIKKSELSRYIFYKKNINNYKSIFCFANVPPPNKVSKKIFIFFHNELLLQTKNINLSFLKKLFFRIKKLYIKNRNNNYNWIVQTNHMKKLLIKELKIKEHNIYKYPFYSEIKMPKNKIDSSTFIYPSSNHPHKNNTTLIKAFMLAASKTEVKLELKITINESDLKIKKRDFPSNLNVEFLGVMSHTKLLNVLNKTKFLIFASLRESFGLPLLEGIQAGCLILAPRLNYVKELIIPSYLFNPYDEREISDVILLALNDAKSKAPSIKIKNSLDLIFNMLVDVQE